MTGRLSPLLIAAAGLVLLSFHADMKEWPSRASSPLFRAAPPRPRLAGRPAPAFSLKLLDGTTFSPAAHKGSVVVLNFFATWCGPCVQEMPELSRFHDANKSRGLVMVGIDAGEPEAAVRAFVKDHAVSFPVGIDASGVQALYGVSAYPTTVVIGKDGKVLHQETGMIRNADVSLKPWLDREAPDGH